MLTNEQFDRTRRLALRLAGIELHERHRDLLYRRCCRTRIESPERLDALLNAAENHVEVHGYSGMMLHTADANLAAIALFKKCGYEVVRRMPKHYRGMFDASEWVKKLAP